MHNQLSREEENALKEESINLESITAEKYHKRKQNATASDRANQSTTSQKVKSDTPKPPSSQHKQTSPPQPKQTPTSKPKTKTLSLTEKVTSILSYPMPPLVKNELEAWLERSDTTENLKDIFKQNMTETKNGRKTIYSWKNTKGWVGKQVEQKIIDLFGGAKFLSQTAFDDF
jgi:hypothetical protein